MNNLAIRYDNDTPTVSARELHTFLEVETRYNDWFSRMCEYGFSDGIDFNLLKNERVQSEGNRIVSRTVDDAQLTIEMAKELCMLQRTEKGKQARAYFINLEKAWNAPELVMARALKMAQNQLDELKNGKQELLQQIAQDKPKVLFADAVTASESSILVGELAKLMKQNGVAMGQKRLFEWLRAQGWLIKRKGEEYNLPTQKAMEQGLFEIKESTIIHSDGYTTISKTSKVTGRGQVYFLNKFLQEKTHSAVEAMTRG